MENLPEAETRYPSEKQFNDLLAGLGIFFLVLLIFFLAQLGVFAVELARTMPGYTGGIPDLSMFQDSAMQNQVERMAENGDVIAQVSFWAGVICTPVILLLTFLWKKEDWRDLLAIRAFQPKQFFIWLGIFMAVVGGIEVLGSLSPMFQSDFMKNVMATCTSLPWLFVGVGLMAPLFEEFLLRGLLYGSLNRVMNMHAAVAVTAGVFTLMHLQYNVMIMLLILPLGVVLGYARAKTGSIWVPIILHAINNSVSVWMLS